MRWTHGEVKMCSVIVVSALLLFVNETSGHQRKIARTALGTGDGKEQELAGKVQGKKRSRKLTSCLVCL